MNWLLHLSPVTLWFNATCSFFSYVNLVLSGLPHMGGHIDLSLVILFVSELKYGTFKLICGGCCNWRNKMVKYLVWLWHHLDCKLLSDVHYSSFWSWCKCLVWNLSLEFSPSRYNSVPRWRGVFIINCAYFPGFGVKSFYLDFQLPCRFLTLEIAWMLWMLQHKRQVSLSLYIF